MCFPFRALISLSYFVSLLQLITRWLQHSGRFQVSVLSASLGTQGGVTEQNLNQEHLPNTVTNADCFMRWANKSLLTVIFVHYFHPRFKPNLVLSLQKHLRNSTKEMHLCVVLSTSV